MKKSQTPIQIYWIKSVNSNLQDFILDPKKAVAHLEILYNILRFFRVLLE